jgi:hypothetical protein
LAVFRPVFQRGESADSCSSCPADTCSSGRRRRRLKMGEKDINNDYVDSYIGSNDIADVNYSIY